MTIELFQFQREASGQIAERFIDYLDDPVIIGTRKAPRRIPFWQALSAITASGKTVILADATAQVAAAMSVAPVVLWLSKGTVVVEQSYTNLLPAGRYGHLIGDAEVKTLAEYDAVEVEERGRPLVYFATVGTFNQVDKEKGDRLIFKSDIDVASTSTWDALKRRGDLNGVRRPLIVVYDEGHNLSDQQADLLMELQPEGFLVASATMRKIPGKLAEVIEALKANGQTDESLITTVNASNVADSGLVKGNLAIGGYRTPMEETVDSMLEDLAEAVADGKACGLVGTPKCIYVANTNMVATDSFRRDDHKRPFTQREAAPILIWRYLVEHHGIDRKKIAVYASLKIDKDNPAPEDFVLFSGGDKDYATFTAGDYEHIIFNQSLQEGWDDPLVYFAYVDRSMESKIAIEQIIGRVLRQPGATHYPVARLNTAHFYIRVDRNETFQEVLDEVAAKIGDDAPTLRLIKTPPGKPKPRQYPVKGDYEVPATAYDARATIKPIEALVDNLMDYRDDTVNTKGVGSRRISNREVGGEGVTDTDWQNFEQSNRVSARWVFTREVKRQFVRALEVASTAGDKFNARIGLGSPASTHVADTAHKVVQTYLKNVSLVQRKVDPYTIGPSLAREADVTEFRNAIHEGYDALNPIESEFAAEIDKTGNTWCRNPSRTGYGIPLITLGATNTFYPDFLVWHDGDVLAVDTKGEHLLAEAAGRKLLNVRPHKDVSTRLHVRFVSRGTFTEKIEQQDREGYTLWFRREDGTLGADHHDDMAAAVTALLT